MRRLFHAAAHPAQEHADLGRYRECQIVVEELLGNIEYDAFLGTTADDLEDFLFDLLDESRISACTQKGRQIASALLEVLEELDRARARLEVRDGVLELVEVRPRKPPHEAADFGDGLLLDLPDEIVDVLEMRIEGTPRHACRIGNRLDRDTGEISCLLDLAGKSVAQRLARTHRAPVLAGADERKLPLCSLSRHFRHARGLLSCSVFHSVCRIAHCA